MVEIPREEFDFLPSSYGQLAISKYGHAFNEELFAPLLLCTVGALWVVGLRQSKVYYENIIIS